MQKKKQVKEKQQILSKSKDGPMHKYQEFLKMKTKERETKIHTKNYNSRKTYICNMKMERNQIKNI